MQEFRRELETGGPSLVIGRGTGGRGRLDSIDLLRGLIMVIMALDHVRDYFLNVRYDPLDLKQTSVALFLTRWVTHFCAPLFIFLAGTSAYLAGTRGKSRTGLSWFLLSRGLWIIVLEFTVVRWGWTFSFDYRFLFVQVLWAIGCSMIALSGLVFLPTWIVTVIGVVMIAGHNALDGVSAAQLGIPDWLWDILHTGRRFELGGDVMFLPAYPLVPWIGVMAAGYGLGAVFLLPRQRRRHCLLGLGLMLTLAFIILRGINIYGDPHPWSARSDGLFTVLSFINCHKYPPSLLYLLMTLGPALIALAAFDRDIGPFGKPLVTFGRVPMFFYLLHVPLIHGLAVALAYVRYSGKIFEPWNLPPDYGYSLAVVYLVWLLVLGILYPPCRWFAGIKRRYRWAWLSYL